MQQNTHRSELSRRHFFGLMPVGVGLALLPELARAIAVDPVQSLVDDFVKSGKSAAVSVAVIRGGWTTFHSAGVANRATNKPASEHVVYEIGSISKTFTGLILARAIIEGHAKLDDDVRKYLPTGYDNLVRNDRPVRLIDLVTTTSGLPDNIPDWMERFGKLSPAEAPFAITKMLAGQGPQQFLADLKGARLVDTPGHLPRHSNVASQLQGVIVERIYRASYDALLARFIEKPFGMRAGGGAVPSTLLAIGYGDDGAEKPPLDIPVIRAAGGLRYSAADMARYISEQVVASNPVIAFTHQPLFGSPETNQVGFHWVIGKTAESEPYLRHSGGSFGCSSYCAFYPERRCGLVVLANRGGAESRTQGLGDAIHAALFGQPKGLMALEAALESSGYADVAGTIAEVKTRFPELHLNEDFMNAWGYRLLRNSRERAALGVFTWNAAMYSESWNTHDSLAEALAGVGDKAGAIVEYRRSLELNPGNDSARAALAELQKQP
ncbi:serine hydrolase [Sphingomonas cannabina]|uniref:serine hydrolase n=1 Tax=Sphingomonas cannabina TaxID=2899123 RepID=UPI001F2D60A8|nr:serine hydrolase [Sphingomonas cannabina]UIJ46264.1 serine hydrolase [Sphingomonas cannabina]